MISEEDPVLWDTASLCSDQGRFFFWCLRITRWAFLCEFRPKPKHATTPVLSKHRISFVIYHIFVTKHLQAV